jgi:hypothetical protein
MTDKANRREGWGRPASERERERERERSRALETDPVSKSVGETKRPARERRTIVSERERTCAPETERAISETVGGIFDEGGDSGEAVPARGRADGGLYGCYREAGRRERSRTWGLYVAKFLERESGGRGLHWRVQPDMKLQKETKKKKKKVPFHVGCCAAVVRNECKDNFSLKYKDVLLYVCSVSTWFNFVRNVRMTWSFGNESNE